MAVVRGNREVARALRELAQAVVVPINAASRFALQPTVKAAREKLRALPLDDSTGTLAKSLTIRRKPGGDKFAPKHQVGPRPDVRGEDGRRPVRYAHLLEFGVAPHYQPERGVDHPGFAPKPFMTPAYYETKDQVVVRFGQKIGPALEKRATQLAVKAFTKYRRTGKF